MYSRTLIMHTNRLLESPFFLAPYPQSESESASKNVNGVIRVLGHVVHAS